MSEDNHRIARTFFAALSNGEVPDELVTPDFTSWSITSGVNSDKARYQGAIRMLASISSGTLSYTIDSLTSEEDRVAAEVQAAGTLITGEEYHNIYVFMLRIRDGRVASVAEYFNPKPVQEKLVPLMQAAMEKSIH